jgi:aspartate aminotransferase-like enzyme
VLKGDNGITIAGGQGDFAGKIFRISHLGYYDDLDMITVVAALERALAGVNHKFAVGSGITATQNSLMER